MRIRKLSVHNFKSFSALEVKLTDLSVLIGANASGKSNFVEILRFLRHVTRHGLENAISMEGGAEYLRNTRIGAEQELCISIVYEPRFKFMQELGNGHFGTDLCEATYEFAIRFQGNAQGRDFEVTRDTLKLNYRFVRLETRDEEIEAREELGIGHIILNAAAGRISIKRQFPANLPIDPGEALGPFLFGDDQGRSQKIPQGILLLETPYFAIPHGLQSPFEEIAVYDFDPKLPKKAVSITGKTELEEDGSNLSFILNRIVGDEEKKRKFVNLIRDLLPFVNDFQVEKFADKSLLFTLLEKYDSQADYLPASFISDGTVNIIALVVALYFEKRPLIVVEEPERNVHPHLIARIVNMFQEVSREKQIIVTTHNPEIVKYVDVEDLFLILRTRAGFSEVIKPGEINEIQTFLKSEIGIEELYIQDLLGVGSAL